MTYKVLGQALGTGALANLYKVPAGKQAVSSTLVLANVGATTATVRVTVAPGDVADSQAQTVLPDFVLEPSERVALTEGWALAPTDAVRMNAPASIAATLFGSEAVNA